MSSSLSRSPDWLARARVELDECAKSAHVAPHFDWRRLERRRPRRAIGTMLAPIAAMALVGGIGLTLSWALGGEENVPEASYQLEDVAARASVVGPAPTKRVEPKRVVVPVVRLVEKPVPQRRRHVVAPAKPEPVQPRRHVELGEGFSPTVIIVKPRAVLPPLFSPEAYRKKR